MERERGGRGEGGDQGRSRGVCVLSRPQHGLLNPCPPLWAGAAGGAGARGASATLELSHGPPRPGRGVRRFDTRGVRGCSSSGVRRLPSLGGSRGGGAALASWSRVRGPISSASSRIPRFPTCPTRTPPLAPPAHPHAPPSLLPHWPLSLLPHPPLSLLPHHPLSFLPHRPLSRPPAQTTPPHADIAAPPAPRCTARVCAGPGRPSSPWDVGRGPASRPHTTQARPLPLRITAGSAAAGAGTHRACRDEGAWVADSDGRTRGEAGRARARGCRACTRGGGRWQDWRVPGQPRWRRVWAAEVAACMGSRGGGEGLDLLVGVGHVDGAAVDPPLLRAPHLQQQHVPAPATTPPSHAGSPLRPCTCF